MTMLRATQSLCPVCLRRIDAAYTEDGTPSGCVFLQKSCPEHGTFRVPVWDASHGGPVFATWSRAKTPSHPVHPGTATRQGCPYDCGLCPEHGQHTCTGLVEVTQRCSMRCPVCYANAGKGAGSASAPDQGPNLAHDLLAPDPALAPELAPELAPDPAPDPALDELDARFAALHRASAGCNVQLSGGEPTERDDLPRIVELARHYDFGLLQLNTNGRRLALEPDYAAALRAAGLDSVYLQWDGVSDATFRALRGHACLGWKHEALRHCLRAGLGVVLVATVVRGINDAEMGALLRLALAQGPGVRGVHFQPMAAFGRCPWTLERAPRFTLPEVVHALETQVPDLIQAGQLHPPGCEHSLCSCSAVYRRVDKGPGAETGLECIPGGGCCDTKPAGGVKKSRESRESREISEISEIREIRAAEGARKAKQFTALHWRGGDAKNACCCEGASDDGGRGCASALASTSAPASAPAPTSVPGLADAFSRFVAGAGVEQRFTVSAMTFQDALSLDLDRVRGCCIHVVADDGRLVPFCAYNLTSAAGIPLHRKPARAPR